MVVGSLSMSLLQSTWAGEVLGVKVPDQREVSGQKLVLNGTGVRRATIFKVNVYVGALYTTEKSRDAEKLLSLSSSAPREVDTFFVREVDVGKVRDAWQTLYRDNCGADCDQLKPSFEKFLATLRSMKSGDQVRYIFMPESVSIQYNQLPAELIEGGRLFNRILLSGWFGQKPVDADLKKGMLDCSQDPACK